MPDEIRAQIRRLVEVLGYLPHLQPLGVVTADAGGRFARILGVANVVGAMASHRSCGPTLGAEPALQEIRSCRGARYDAEACD